MARPAGDGSGDRRAAPPKPKAKPDWKPAKGYAEDDYRRGKDGKMRLAITTRPKSAAGKGRKRLGASVAPGKPSARPHPRPLKPVKPGMYTYFGDAEDVKRGTVKAMQTPTPPSRKRPVGKMGGKR